MKNRWITLFFCLLAGLSTALADGPFRNHRYDAFKVLKTSTSDNIVFIGNSITNMHEWWAVSYTHLTLPTNSRV